MRKVLGAALAVLVGLGAWIAGNLQHIPSIHQPAVTQDRRDQDREHPPKEDQNAQSPVVGSVGATASATTPTFVDPGSLTVYVVPKQKPQPADPQQPDPQKADPLQMVAEIGLFAAIVFRKDIRRLLRAVG